MSACTILPIRCGGLNQIAFTPAKRSPCRKRSACGCGFRAATRMPPAQYRRLLTRIAQEGMQIAGLSCEIAPIDYGITNGTEQVVPENCIPVRRP